MPATVDVKKQVQTQKRVARRLRGHAGQWVAIRGDRVVATDETFDGIRAKVREKPVDRVFRVPPRKMRMLL